MRGSQPTNNSSPPMSTSLLKTHNDYGKLVDKHERLVKARRCLNTLLKNEHVSTSLDPCLYENGETIGSLPSTNNQIEGAVNSQLCALLFDHRGINIDHQLRTIGWWCYLHTETPTDPAEILRIMPTRTQTSLAPTSRPLNYASLTATSNVGVLELTGTTSTSQPHIETTTKTKNQHFLSYSTTFCL